VEDDNMTEITDEIRAQTADALRRAKTDIGATFDDACRGLAEEWVDEFGPEGASRIVHAILYGGPGLRQPVACPVAQGIVGPITPNRPPFGG
jgi:hypothetical protein